MVLHLVRLKVPNAIPCDLKHLRVRRSEVRGVDIKPVTDGLIPLNKTLKVVRVAVEDWNELRIALDQPTEIKDLLLRNCHLRRCGLRWRPDKLEGNRHWDRMKLTVRAPAA